METWSHKVKVSSQLCLLERPFMILKKQGHVVAGG